MNHTFKTQYAQIEKAYKKILEEEKTVFDKDFKKAQEIYPEIEKVLQSLEVVFNKIHNDMSEFNAPGLSAALTNAIKAGLAGKKFNPALAKMTLDKYFDR